VGDHCPCRIEHNGVPHRPGGTVEDAVRLRRVEFRVATNEFGRLRAGQPEAQRIEGELVDGAGLNPPDGAGGCGGQFIESVVAVYHQHAGPPGGEYAGHHFGRVRERTTD